MRWLVMRPCAASRKITTGEGTTPPRADMSRFGSGALLFGRVGSTYQRKHTLPRPCGIGPGQRPIASLHSSSSLIAVVSISQIILEGLVGAMESAG